MNDKVEKNKKAKEATSVISEKTLVPLSLVITFLGFVGWLTYVAHTTNANARTIIEMKVNTSTSESKVVAQLIEMNTRLSRIEGKLNGLRIRR